MRRAKDGWAIESGQYAKAKGALPDWYTDCPPAVRGDYFYIESFWELSSCRVYGQGTMGPIPWTALVQFSDRCKMDETTARIFLTVIRHLDQTWLEWQRSQNP